jgi:hypothetical protein
MTEFSRSSKEPAPKKEEPAGGLAPPESEEETIAQPEASEEPEAETVVKLSQPSKELATRLLGKVSFKERLIGSVEHPSPGASDTSIYSFEEAAIFLDGGNLTGKDYTRTIRFDALKKWVGETYGDKELAQAIGEITKELLGNWTVPYQRYLKSLVLIKPVKELMLQRVKQCKEIMGIEIIGGETEA